MNAELKQQWVEALRSGDYVQGTGYLKQDNEGSGQVTHCCLGVLCEVVDPSQFSPLTFSFTYGPPQTCDSLNLPDWLKKEVGLTIDDCDRLVELNDSEHKSFHDIATFIEDTY